MPQTSRFRPFVAIVLSVVLVAAACGSGADDSSTASSSAAPTAAVAETTAAPATTAVLEAEAPTIVPDPDVDPMVAVREQITEVLAQWQEDNGAPAVSLSVRLPGSEPIDIALGVTDLITEEPVTTESVFRIGSITKTVTSAVVLQLVDEGLIELDEPVRTYLPEWLEGYEYSDEITIRQLLNHTNGLVEFALDVRFFAAAGQRIDEAMEPEEIYEWLAEQQPLFAPGEEYSYETGGFVSLGSVIEAVTGNTAADEIRARIFVPAGANNIFLAPTETPPTEIVNGYNRDALYTAMTSVIKLEDTDGLTIKGEPVVGVLGYPQAVLRSAGWTGGGLEAQPESVSGVYKAIFDGTILSDEQIAEMTNPVLDGTYGLGVSTNDVDGTTVYSHGGGVPGYRSQAGYLPEYDIAYAVSSTLIPLPEGAGVGDFRERLVPVLVEVIAALDL